MMVAAPQAGADEAFYVPPSPLPAGGNGEVIKQQPSNYPGTKATRIMYLSRNAKNQPIPVTGTIIVPTQAWTGAGPRPIVAYAPFTSGMGDQCAPSKTLVGEGAPDMTTSFQNSFVNGLLGKGFAVAQTDYEGLGTPGEHPYAMRLSEARTTLDVLRAAQRLPGTGLDPRAPLGIAGYSEGGGAAASAAEMASSYAPELPIKGVYSGAAPADKATLAKALDGGMYAGFLGYALIGIDTAYPESHIGDLANAAGQQFLEEARKTCTVEAVFKYLFKQSSSLTKDGRPVSAYLSQAPFDRIVAENRIGTAKPAAPVLVQHSAFDDVIPYNVGKQLAKDWCAQGADIEFRDLFVFSPFLAHALGLTSAAGEASNWLADRFAGKPTASNCAKP
ncbi:lipase family protein [Streptomyces sp. NPDC046887]|uniref:lipase family protein n=1 Tax=Streptomyces sp. NPDC046887 TaxID=3155472 RepID=UPI0033BFD169